MAQYRPEMTFPERAKLLHSLHVPKQAQIEEVPNPAVREMLRYLSERGIETTFDRADRQHPQCPHGLMGLCCAFCSYGPCRFDEKRPRGICGKDGDLSVVGNALRRLAAGLAAHGMHGREVFIALKRAGERKIPLPIRGRAKAIVVARMLGIKTSGRTVEEICVDIADTFLDDLSRPLPKKHETLLALAPYERTKVWEDLDIIPISAYHEAFEALNVTSHGTDSEFQSLAKAFLRTTLVYAWSTVVSTSLSTDILYGPPARRMIEVNMGAIDARAVTVAVHGHSPTLAAAVVEIAGSAELQERARQAGANGVQVLGICCTGGEFLGRGQVPVPITAAASSAELVVGTGAVDVLVVDQQDVLPGIMDVANCFHTKVVTTLASAHYPGAIPMELDYYFSNLDRIYDIARGIVELAIQNYAQRDPEKLHVPEHKARVMAGFGLEEVMKIFNGSIRYNLIYGLAELLRAGQLRGIVNFGSCSNIRGTAFERNHVVIARELIKHDVLVTCHGCAGSGIIFSGLGNPEAAKLAGPKLRRVCEAKGIPPALHVGPCVDSTRAAQIMTMTSMAAGVAMPNMPFAMVAADPAAEKTMGARYAFVMSGVTTYSCVDDNTLGSDRWMQFVGRDLEEMVGARLVWETDPYTQAENILQHLNRKRAALGWPVELYRVDRPEEGEVERAV